MRILLVSQQFPPETALGGIGTQAVAKACGLVGLGHDVHVLTRAAGPRTHHEHIDGMRVTRISTSGLAGRTEVASWMAASVAVATWVGRLEDDGGRFDIIDVPEYGAEGLVAATNRTPWQHTPIAVQVHGSTDMLTEHIGWPERGSDLHRLGGWMERTSLELADLVYASSTFSARWAADVVGRTCDDIAVWHSGVDTTTFRPTGPAVAPPTLVFVGRIAASKGVDVLLTAAEMARRHVPDVRVRLVGRVDADGAAVLRAFPADLVEVVGPLAHDALPGALAGASLFIAPSRFEAGPGLVYLEAMACGLPVVATRVGGLPEVVLPEETGVLVPAGEPAALATAIVALLLDDDRRTAIARAAREWVVANADTRTLMPKLVALYERVAG